MRALLLCILALGGLQLPLSAQKKDIRNHSIFNDRTSNLKVTYQYYYDFWAEQEVKHGAYSRWDKKGRLVFETFYKNGVQDSLVLQYYPDGTLRSKVPIEAGQPEGVAIWFRKNGEVKKRVIFQNGEKTKVKPEKPPKEQSDT